MAKLAYDNIFESIMPNKKKAAAMSTASEVLSDLDDVLTIFGFDQESKRTLTRAVQRLHFRRYA